MFKSISTFDIDSKSRLVTQLPLSVQSVYIIGAKVALDQGNYALALLDSDYMLSDEQSIQQNVSEGELYNATSSLVNSSRFGSWATQFADEALFYMNESSLWTDRGSCVTSLDLLSISNVDMPLNI